LVGKLQPVTEMEWSKVKSK